MTLLPPLQDCLDRVFMRKRTIFVLILLFLSSIVLGIVLVITHSSYTYHLELCDDFLNEVCFSDTNFFLVFLKRTASHGLLLLIILACGIHFTALIVPPAIIIYRAYTFGGCICIFFSVYRFTGAIIAIFLYLPVHLLLDCVLIMAATLSFSRASRFCMCGDELKELLFDFLVLLILIAVICLAEAILLLVLFRPIGNII